MTSEKATEMTFERCILAARGGSRTDSENEYANTDFDHNIVHENPRGWRAYFHRARLYNLKGRGIPSIEMPLLDEQRVRLMIFGCEMLLASPSFKSKIFVKDQIHRLDALAKGLERKRRKGTLAKGPEGFNGLTKAQNSFLNGYMTNGNKMWMQQLLCCIELVRLLNC